MNVTSKKENNWKERTEEEDEILWGFADMLGKCLVISQPSSK